MAAVRTPDRGNVESMLAGREPVGDLRADCPALPAAIAGLDLPSLSGHEKHDPRAHRFRLGKPPVQPRMGGIERGAVQIEREVRLHQTARQLPVPA